ncbi:MAG: ComF family protein [Candidatus Flemingiibacterium sp.]
MKIKLKSALDRFIKLLFPECCALCGEPVESYRECALCSTCLVKWQLEKDACRDREAGLPVRSFTTDEISGERDESSKERSESSKERGESSKERGESSKERSESSKERSESSKERGESSKERSESSKERFGQVVYLSNYRPGDPDNAVRALIHKLKRHATKILVDFIAGEYRELLLQAAPMLFDGTVAPGEVIVTWIPRRDRAVIEIGYDHMELCAKRLAELSGFECRRLISRTGEALEQKKLGARDRMLNAERSMASAAAGLDGKYVVLIDDLVTTGASMKVGERLISDAGAEMVICAALASD